MKRRHFIRNTLAASVAALGGVAALQMYQQNQLDYSETENLGFLSKDDQVLLSVLIPVFTSGIPQQPSVAITIANIDKAIMLLPLRTQDELRQLLDGLSNSFGRLILAQVWVNWQAADVSQVNQFLDSIREHSIGLLQDAYVGLHKTILGAVYAEADAWPTIDYPGPPF
ncbi:hypothetical protein FLL45_06625 [Aliikangiella marina]|uniref:Twin-arginine translocation signal domain-containing protein n=1 Tax=Aliikangiella marina TaxID=1712262 RepID=A0A545TBM4_9GAMM|nr:hypothetical protein [Aliikangiella marina]TQV74633.1 hypothetical protein FLL45_06625 [Aliikangiella marina]